MEEGSGVTTTDNVRAAEAATSLVEVLPGVWRWADPTGSDRCGTALVTPEGLVLVDPPALDPEARQTLERAAGPVRHVVLTHVRHAPLAAPFRAAGAGIWAPPGGAGIDGAPSGDVPPGGLAICQLPADAAPGEVALFWDGAGDALLLTGDSFPVVGQIPVYLEGVAPPVPAYAGLARALLAMDPQTLVPGRQAPPDPGVMLSTGYAAHVGTPFHRRRAAPVEGPRFLVPQAARILEETLVAPVVLRRSEGQATWLADPFACTRCGRPSTPAVRTCGGPFIPRLCPDCRARARVAPPALRMMACAGGCCTRDGSRVVLSALRQAIAAQGLAGEVEVAPVSCLGECGIGPLVAVQTARGQEPPGATRFRQARDARLRQYAADEDEELDEASERVLARFTALVQPGEADELVRRLARDRRPDATTEP
jgi:hypothetical protein